MSVLKVGIELLHSHQAKVHYITNVQVKYPIILMLDTNGISDIDLKSGVVFICFDLL
jgi:hypothetical protein